MLILVGSLFDILDMVRAVRNAVEICGGEIHCYGEVQLVDIQWLRGLRG